MPNATSGLTTYPLVRLQTIFSMGFFNIGSDRIGVSRQGWIYLAFTLPLTVVVVVASFAWIWWTGTKVEKPKNPGQAIVQVANTLGRVAFPAKVDV